MTEEGEGGEVWSAEVDHARHRGCLLYPLPRDSPSRVRTLALLSQDLIRALYGSLISPLFIKPAPPPPPTHSVRRHPARRLSTCGEIPPSAGINYNFKSGDNPQLSSQRGKLPTVCRGTIVGRLFGSACINNFPLLPASLDAFPRSGGISPRCSTIFRDVLETAGRSLNARTLVRTLGPLDLFHAQSGEVVPLVTLVTLRIHECLPNRPRPTFSFFLGHGVLRSSNTPDSKRRRR